MRDVLVDSGVCLALLTSLPLLAVLAFALRPVILAAAVLGLIVCAVIAGCGMPGSTAVQAPTEPARGEGNLRLPPDVMLQPDHGWLRIEDGDAVRIGVDDLVQSALGPVHELELPAIGRRVRYGDPLARLKRHRRSVAIRAPVTGRVVARNEEACRRPELVNEEPYGAGWLVVVRADDLPERRRHLMHGLEAGAWFHREVERVLGLVKPSIARSLRDDVPTRTLYLWIDDAIWASLTETSMAGPQVGADQSSTGPTAAV